MEAMSGRFNPHVHVEYDWNLRLDELDESDDELDDKVGAERASETGAGSASFCRLLSRRLSLLSLPLSPAR